MGFAIGLVSSVINLLDGQVMFFEESKLQRNCKTNLLIKTFLGLVEMMFGLVNVSFSSPEWQAVKLKVTFFALCRPLDPIYPFKCFNQGLIKTSKEISFDTSGKTSLKSGNIPSLIKGDISKQVTSDLFLHKCL